MVLLYIEAAYRSWEGFDYFEFFFSSLKTHIENGGGVDFSPPTLQASKGESASEIYITLKRN